MSRYHQLPIAQKRAESIARVREPAVTCPDCDTQVMTVDLHEHHVSRCPGRREPGPGSKWVTYREALAFGVPKRTLVRWVRRGHVRVKGGRGDRLYLLRDLTTRIVQQRASRRR